MARPTINFTGGLITAAGDYYFEVPVGVPLKISGKGSFGGSTLSLLNYIPAIDGVAAVIGGLWTENFEDTLTSPYAVCLLQVSAGSPVIAFDWAPVKNTVHPS